MLRQVASRFLLVQVCAAFSTHELDRFVMRLIHALCPNQETQEQMGGIEVPWQVLLLFQRLIEFYCFQWLI